MLSQIPVADKDTLATLVIMIAVFLWLANQVKTLMQKPALPPIIAPLINLPGDEPIKRIEFERSFVDYKGSVQIWRDSVMSRVSNLEKQQSELTVSSHLTTTKMREELHSIDLKIEQHYSQLRVAIKESENELLNKMNEKQALIEKLIVTIGRLEVGAEQRKERNERNEARGGN